MHKCGEEIAGANIWKLKMRGSSALIPTAFDPKRNRLFSAAIQGSCPVVIKRGNVGAEISGTKN